MNRKIKSPIKDPDNITREEVKLSVELTKLEKEIYNLIKIIEDKQIDLDAEAMKKLHKNRWDLYES